MQPATRGARRGDPGAGVHGTDDSAVEDVGDHDLSIIVDTTELEQPTHGDGNNDGAGANDDDGLSTPESPRGDGCREGADPAALAALMEADAAAAMLRSRFTLRYVSQRLEDEFLAFLHKPLIGRTLLACILALQALRNINAAGFGLAAVVEAVIAMVFVVAALPTFRCIRRRAPPAVRRLYTRARSAMVCEALVAAFMATVTIERVSSPAFVRTLTDKDGSTVEVHNVVPIRTMLIIATIAAPARSVTVVPAALLATAAAVAYLYSMAPRPLRPTDHMVCAWLIVDGLVAAALPRLWEHVIREDFEARRMIDRRTQRVAALVGALRHVMGRSRPRSASSSPAGVTPSGAASTAAETLRMGGPSPTSRAPSTTGRGREYPGSDGVGPSHRRTLLLPHATVLSFGLTPAAQRAPLRVGDAFELSTTGGGAPGGSLGGDRLTVVEALIHAIEIAVAATGVRAFRYGEAAGRFVLVIPPLETDGDGSDDDDAAPDELARLCNNADGSGATVDWPFVAECAGVDPTALAACAVARCAHRVFGPLLGAGGSGATATLAVSIDCGAAFACDGRGKFADDGAANGGELPATSSLALGGDGIAGAAALVDRLLVPLDGTSGSYESSDVVVVTRRLADELASAFVVTPLPGRAPPAPTPASGTTPTSARSRGGSSARKLAHDSAGHSRSPSSGHAEQQTGPAADDRPLLLGMPCGVELAAAERRVEVRRRAAFAKLCVHRGLGEDFGADEDDERSDSTATGLETTTRSTKTAGTAIGLNSQANELVAGATGETDGGGAVTTGSESEIQRATRTQKIARFAWHPWRGYRFRDEDVEHAFLRIEGSDRLRFAPAAVNIGLVLVVAVALVLDGLADASPIAWLLLTCAGVAHIMGAILARRAPLGQCRLGGLSIVAALGYVPLVFALFVPDTASLANPVRLYFPMWCSIAVLVQALWLPSIVPAPVPFVLFFIGSTAAARHVSYAFYAGRANRGRSGGETVWLALEGALVTLMYSASVLTVRSRRRSSFAALEAARRSLDTSRAARTALERRFATVMPAVVAHAICGGDGAGRAPGGAATDDAMTIMPVGGIRAGSLYAHGALIRRAARLTVTRAVVLALEPAPSSRPTALRDLCRLIASDEESNAQRPHAATAGRALLLVFNCADSIAGQWAARDAATSLAARAVRLLAEAVGVTAPQQLAAAAPNLLRCGLGLGPVQGALVGSQAVFAVVGAAVDAALRTLAPGCEHLVVLQHRRSVR